MPPRTQTRPWILAALIASAVAACGGGDDAPTPIDPPITPSNLADCHNPSMYTVGSNWSVEWDAPGYDRASLPLLAAVPWPEDKTSTYVLAPPPEWQLPPGTIQLSPYAPGEYPLNWTGLVGSGRYLILQDNAVHTVLTAIWTRFSREFPVLHYDSYTPALTEPLSLRLGEIYQSQPVAHYRSGSDLTSNPDSPGSPLSIRPPLLDGSGSLQADAVSVTLTYVGRETLSVPAGTFSTCHTRRSSAGTEEEEWRVAEGPYKGITIKAIKKVNGESAQWAAKAVRADWK